MKSGDWLWYYYNIITEVYMISFKNASGGYCILCTTLSNTLFTRNLKTTHDEIQQVLHNDMYSLLVKLIVETTINGSCC